MQRPRLTLLALLTVAGLISACGGSPAEAPTATPGATVTATPAESPPGTAAPPATAGPTPAGGGNEFVPGTARFRAINLLDEPVDLYARTTDGLVQAFLLQAGLAPGVASEFFSPPDPGRFVILRAGATDTTCVSTCPDTLVDSRADDLSGPTITEVLYSDSGQPRSFTVWEEAPASSAGSANRMPDADPAAGLFVPLAVALTDADFGLLIADANGEGCLANRDQSNILIGGNQTPVFAYDGASITVNLHSNTDRECSADPVGGPFIISGGAGSRTLLALSGSPGDMDAVLVTLDSDEPPPPPPSADPNGSAGDAVAIAAMASFLAEQLPQLSATDTECLARGIVTAVGSEKLLDSAGQPLDFANVEGPLGDELETALFNSVEGCNLDPSVLE